MISFLSHNNEHVTLAKSLMHFIVLFDCFNCFDMGISGLLPLLKSIQKPVQLKDYKGQTFAVDAYSWLHKAAYSCATELCLGRPTRRYVDVCLNKIKMMRSFGVEPYIVFDGCPLPMKAGTDGSRARFVCFTTICLLQTCRRRAQLKKDGEAAYASGLKKKANECFQQCVDVTPQMALALIKDLRSHNVKYVVAPYEADAQMAYLEKIGLVNGIITEDSDLLVFGCKRVLFKLNNSGDAMEINSHDLESNKELNFAGWDFEKFRTMCIFSGCDYLENIPGVGLKTAYKELSKHSSLDKMIKSMKMDKNWRDKVPADYMERFKRAEMTFLHQQVFDPNTNSIVYLNDLPDELKETDTSFLGNISDPEFALGLSKGEICPLTGEKLHDFEKQEQENENKSSSDFMKNQIAQKLKSNFNLLSNSYVASTVSTGSPKRIKLKPLAFNVGFNMIQNITPAVTKPQAKSQATALQPKQNSILKFLTFKPKMHGNIIKQSESEVKEESVVKSKFFIKKTAKPAGIVFTTTEHEESLTVKRQKTSL